MISPQVTKHQMAFIKPFPPLNGKNVILLALESQAGQWEGRTDSLPLLYTHLAKKVREPNCDGVMPGKAGRAGKQRTETLLYWLLSISHISLALLLSWEDLEKCSKH